MRTVTQYAFAIGTNRVGPWRQRRAEAALDALRHGCAERDPFDRRIVYVAVPGDIISRKVEPPMESRSVDATGADRSGQPARRPALRLVT